MFENLTARERVLAMTVLSLVPITILFMGVFWFINSYNDNNGQLMSLTQQISEEDGKMKAAIRANQRRVYYRSVSLPSNVVDASNEYQIWLKNLVRDKLKMDFKSVTPRDAGELKFKNKIVGKARSFTLLATADLEQLTEFLHEFYSVDLLHRINSLKVIPLSAGSTNGKKVRTGKLSLIVTIEAVSLVDADASREFTTEYRELARTDEEYQTAILRRNVFGPANNTPTVSARPSSSYTSETDIKVPISAEDADESDLLSFELLESSIEGVKLVQPSDGSRKTVLEIPGQKEGKYEFKIGVRDSGFPAKSNEEMVSVTFKNRVVVEKKPDPPKPPPFENAKETRITGIVKDKSGHWIVWVKVRTTGERFQLQEGESFELDRKTWTVQSIQPDQATIKVDDSLMTFKPADAFSKPREVVELKTEVNAEVPNDLEGDPGSESIDSIQTDIETS